MRSIRRLTRTLGPAAVLALGLLALPEGPGAPAPAAAFTEASCSGDGPIVPTRIAAGGVLTIFGSYTDWADPGTVIATFRGPGGRTRTATAGNSADGTYLIDERFSAADAGAWTATVTLSETAGSVTCTDRFRVALATPSTDTAPGTADPGPGAAGAAPVLAALAGLLGAWLALRRTRSARDGRGPRG